MGEPSSSWQTFNFKDDEGSTQGMQALRLLLAKLQEAQENPCLKPSVNNLLMTQDLALTSTVRPPSRVHEPSPMEDVEEAPPVYGPKPRDAEEVPDKGKAPKEDERGRKRERTNDRSAKKRRNRSSSDSSSSKSGRSSHGRFHRKRKKSPSPPSSPSNSDNEASSKPSSPPHKAKHKRRKHPAWKRSEKLQKFKEGGKNVTFLTFDGTYGDTDKVLNFIQQFDAAFEGEAFTEASKLRHVAMYLQKTGRQ